MAINKNLIKINKNHMHVVIKFLLGSEKVKFKKISRLHTIEISKSRIPTKKL